MFSAYISHYYVDSFSDSKCSYFKVVSSNFCTILRKSLRKSAVTSKWKCMLEFSQIKWSRNSPNVDGAFNTKEFCLFVCRSNYTTKALLFQYLVPRDSSLCLPFCLNYTGGVFLCFFTSPWSLLFK